MSFDLYKEKKIYRDDHHDHYWILDGVLHESYGTIRGLRWRELCEVPGYDDCDNVDLDADLLEKINNEFGK